MAGLNSKAKQLYDALKADGADVGTEQEFNDYFYKPGAEGYRNRHDVWQAFKDDGADVGESYEEFAAWLGLKPQSSPKPQSSTPTQQPSAAPAVQSAPASKNIQPAQQMQAVKPQAQKPSQFFKLRRGGQDITVSTDEVNKYGGLQGWASHHPGAPVRVYMHGNGFSGHVDLSVASQKRKEKGYKYTLVSGQTPASGKPAGSDKKLTLAQRQQGLRDLSMQQARTDALFEGNREFAQNMKDYQAASANEKLNFEPTEGKPVFNPKTGKLEKVYVTPSGNRTTDKVAADIESHKTRVAIGAADMSIGAQIRRAEEELAGMRKDYDESKSRVHEEWKEDAEKNTAPLGALLAADTYSARQMADKENSALRAAIRQKEVQIRKLKRERDRQIGKDVGFWRGFGETVSDVRTWDFGIGDLTDALTMMNYKSYIGPNATEREKRSGRKMMQAIHDNEQTDQLYGDNDSFWFRAGTMTGEMPAFMLDFALSGGGMEGFNVATKAAGKLSTKLIGKAAIKEMAELGVKQYVKKYGARGLGRMAGNWTVKALGTTADELFVRAPLMTNTIQSAKTASDIIERKLGSVKVDNDGNYDFSNDKTWGSAVWQGEANAIIENYSEMFGTHLDVAGALLKKGGIKLLEKTFGAKRISGMLAKANASGITQIMNTTRKQFERMGVSDYFGEVGEEYYGQLWRSMLNLDDAYRENPDGTRTNLLLDGQFHGDIWGGMALSMGLMGSGKYASSGISYCGMKHKVNVADRVASQIFSPERWEILRGTIDNTSNNDIGTLAETIMADKSLNNKMREAAMDYLENSLVLRGHNLGEVAKQRGGTPDSSGFSINTAYMSGYDNGRPSADNEAIVLRDIRVANASKFLSQDEIDNLLEYKHQDGTTSADTFREMVESGNFTAEQLAVAKDLAESGAAISGINARYDDEIKEQIRLADEEIDSQTNASTGKIHRAKLDIDGREVYIVGGNFVVNEDGEIDTTNSDRSLAILDPNSGQSQFIDPKRLVSIEEGVDSDEEKMRIHEAISEQSNKENSRRLSGQLSFEQGEVIDADGGNAVIAGPYVDEAGNVSEDEVVVVYGDGQAYVMSKDAVQEMANQSRYARIYAEEQKRFAGRQEGGGATIEAEESSEEGMPSNEEGEGANVNLPFALNDEFTFVDADGKEMNGTIVAELEDGLLQVSLDDPAGSERTYQCTPEELEAIIISYNGQPIGTPDSEERPGEEQASGGSVEESESSFEANEEAIAAVTAKELQDAGITHFVSDRVAEGYLNESRQRLKSDVRATMDYRDGRISSYDYLHSLGYATGPNSLLENSTQQELDNEADKQAAKYSIFISEKSTDAGNAEGSTEESELPSFEQIPVDDSGQPMLTEAAPELVWDGIVERAKGNEKVATIVADKYLNEVQAALEAAEKKLANAQRAESTKSDADESQLTLDERIAAEEAGLKALEEAESGVREAKRIRDHWKSVVSTKETRERNAIIAEQENARQRAAERAEAEKAEREAQEEAARLEREALEGIPEWHMDTPENARKRGVRRFGGQMFTRQAPLQGVAGKEVEVKFSQKDLPKGRVAVIEASQLQPSHIQGQRNPMFFIDEAQPKDRSESVSANAAQKIAERIRPQEITMSATAYSGAPTVNSRGEVIQGNNRSDALRYLWDNNLPEQQQTYKQYLLDNAEQMGLDPEAVNAMQQPVLVNMLDVDDAEAIRLGQMTAQDTESGGIERIKPKNVAQKLGSKMRTFANRLLNSGGEEEATFGQLVDRNGIDVLKWMRDIKAISETQYQSAFDTKGNLSAEAKNDLQKVLCQSVFKGGSQQLEEMFGRLPAKAQRAILSTAFRDMDSPEAGRMLHEIQASIVAYSSLMEDSSFAKAKNLEAALGAVEDYKRSYALDDRFEQYRPADNFSNFALHLAALYKAGDMSQTTIAGYFNKMYDLAQGKVEAGIFEEADTTKYPLAEVIKQVLDIDYQPAKNGNNNVANGGADVALRNQGSSGGESRGSEPPSGGEQSSAGTEPSDSGARASDDSGRGRADSAKGQADLQPSEEVTANLSKETNEYGKPFVLAKDGTTTFGVIDSESGLTVAPIRLSLGENRKGKDGKNHGYGLLHIEAGHGNQIREAGYSSVEEFVEEVAKNYTDIREGAKIGENQTYLLEVSDEHNNTLFVQLSKDGTYWNINSAGIFKKKYSRRKPKVYSVPAVGESIDTDTSEVNSGHSVGATAPAGDSSQTSDDKVNTLSSEEQTDGEKSSLGKRVAAASEDVNTNPTDAQKEAGNYKKGHVRVGSFDVSIEQPVGSVRRGKDADGKEWESEMHHTYGYIRGTESVDGDHIDVFISADVDGWNGRKAFVVDQYNPDGIFDEHKVMLGFNDRDEAFAAYLSNYEKGWENGRRLDCTEVNMEDFEKWIDSSKRKTKPFAEYASVKKAESQEPMAEKIDGYTSHAEWERDMRDSQSDDLPDAETLARLKTIVRRGIGMETYSRRFGNAVTTSGNIRGLYQSEKALVEKLGLRRLGGLMWWDEADGCAYAVHYNPAQYKGQKDVLNVTVDSYGEPGSERAGYTITPTKYTNKSGRTSNVFLVKFDRELRVDEHAAAVALCKEPQSEKKKTGKGWYDSKQGGFMMRTEEAARELAAMIGDKEAVADRQPLSLDDMRTTVSEKTVKTAEEKPAMQQVGVESLTGALRRDGEARLSDHAKPVERETGEQAQKEEKPKNPSGNKLVTDERYAELRERMRKKFGGQLNMGIDPEILAIGTEMAVYHIEKGSRKFAAYAKAMIADLGDVIRPYLKSFYNAVRDMPEVEAAGLIADMDNYEEVRKVDIANFDKPTVDIFATAEAVVAEQKAEEQRAEAEKKLKEQRKERRNSDGSTTETIVENGTTIEVTKGDFIPGASVRNGKAEWTGPQTVQKKRKSGKAKPATDGGLFDDLETPSLVKLEERPEEELAGDSAEFQKRETQGVELAKEISTVIEMRVQILALDKDAVKPLTMTEVKKLASKYDALAGISDTDLQELVELAMTQLTRQKAHDAMFRGAEEQRIAYDFIVNAYRIQPSLNARDSERLIKQQYSTPTPFGFVMGQFLHAGGQEVLSALEPSAGNGALTITMTPSAVHVNDIDDARLSNLRKLRFGKVTAQDALLPFSDRVDAVITNPPFGTVTERVYDGIFKISSLEGQMAINALDSMKDDGRAAIVIGGNTSYRTNGSMNPKDAQFFGYLYSHYNVADVINISGKALYSRNGTGYDVRIILIDGRKTGEFERVYPPVKAKARAEQVTTFDELYKRIQDDIQQIQQVGNRSANEQREAGAASDGTTGAPVRSGNDRTDEGAGQRPGATSNAVGSPRRANSGQPARINNGRSSAGVDNADGGNAGSTDNVPRPKPQPADSAGGGSTQDGRRRSGDDGRSAATSRPDRGTERLEVKPDLSAEKVPYPNQSENGFTLMSVVPAAQAQVLQRSLGEIGDVDQFLVDELGYSSKDELYGYLAAEQIDSVALAIHQMNKGNAFIIGDMTGVGKGRQGAALIRYAVKQGKVPIYFTQKPTLFTDNYRDLADIGSSDLRPFIIASNVKDASIVDADGNMVHKLPSKKEQERVFKYIMEHGGLPDEYDYVLTTYDQIKNGTSDYIQREDGTWNVEARKLPRKSNGYTTADHNGQMRRDALAKLAEGNIAILDESHTVGGDSGCGRYMQMLTSEADGVTFLSATFAKRADNMPIYAQRTAIAEAGVKASELIEAIMKGGVTLQEIMSKQLVESGQMIRRERNFDGVTIDWLSVAEDTDRRQREQFNEVADIFNAIRGFQNDFIKPIIDGMNESAAERGATVGITHGTKDMGVKNVPFASKMYNLVNQLLFALKVDAVADRVIENLRNGCKPVISFTNTMEGFLSAAPKGEAMDEMPNFSLTLMRALDGVMRFTEKDADENSEGGAITLDQLSVEGQETYNAIRRKIMNLSADLPISPMDAIRMKIEDAGYSVAEITGRTMQLNRTEDGRYIVEARKDRDKKAAMRDFNSGKLDVLMINKSGSTGISLHASSKFEDQRQRVMVFAQFQSDINDEVQMRGRIDRSGQVCRGRYEYIMSTIPAEQRIQMMFKAKLKSLDANTTSSQKSKFNEMEIVDYLNKYGDEVVWEYMKEHPELEERLGDPLEMLSDNNSDEGPKTSDKENTKKKNGCAGKISRYLAFLSVEEQDEIFREITEAYRVKIQLLDDAGENDLEITTMPLRAETKKRSMWHQGENPGGGNAFADNTYVEEVEVDVLKKPMKRSEILEQQRKLLGDEYLDSDGTVNWDKYVRAKTTEIQSYYVDKADKTIEKMTASAEARIAKEREKAIRNAQKARAKGENNFTDEQIAQLADVVANEQRENERVKLEKRRMEIMAVYNRINNLAVRLRSGQIYVVPQDLKQTTGDLFTTTFGTFVGFKFNKSYTLGSSTAIFATLDGRRKVELALSDKAIDAIITSTQTIYRYMPDKIREISMDNWDSHVPTQTRAKRYIITGNLLQALVDTEKGDRTRGNLISYSTIDGETRQGILMGENFKPTDLRNSTPLSARLAQIREGDAVISEDGDVCIEKSNDWRYRGEFELRVPKSKQRGGIYTMHPDLLKLVDGNNFITKGNKMVAYIVPGNLAKVVDMLSRAPFNVTVLEESKLTSASEPSVEYSAENANFASRYETADGKTINYTSENTEGYGGLFDFDFSNDVSEAKDGTTDSRTGPDVLQRQGDSLLAGRNRRLNAKQGEFSLVERVFTENGAFNFTSGERIESADDVAFIFSSLEDAAKEHAFVVYVKNGQPIVVELGMGTFTQTMVDIPTAALAYNRIKPDQVYFVHNHPSGNLKCSPQDVQMLQTIEGISDVPVFGVIINLKTGKYGTFDTANNMGESRKRVPDMEQRLSVHTLDKQIFSPDYDPMAQPLVRNSQDVAQFLNSHRMGDRAKISFLILTQAGRIVGNIHTGYTKIGNNEKRLARFISENVIRFGGRSAILYGDFPTERYHMYEYHGLAAAVNKLGGVNLLDIVRVEGNHTWSAGDEGMIREPGNEYGASPDGDIRFREAEEDILYRPVTDEATLRKLNSEPTVKVYRAMQMIDGGLRPPMSAKVDGKLREATEIGVWEESEERPELADDKGRFKLDKGNKSSIKAAYNPYFHTSRSPINDQFSSAWNRPGLVTVEVEVPASELTSGYHADKAMDPVGEKPWKSGPVSRMLAKIGQARKVILSRWCRVVRVVPVEEVADAYAQRLNAHGIEVPFNTVPPSLRDALAARGVRIGKPEKGNAGKKSFPAFEKWIMEQVYERAGDGHAYSDAEVSFENDISSRLLGKNRFGKKRQAAYAARERQRMAERILRLAERMHLDNIEVVTDLSKLVGKKAKAKGFYDKNTGKITIVIPNHASSLDVQQTLLHEAVAHYGLRRLFGSRFDTFLDNVFEAADPEIRHKISQLAAKNGWNVRTATEEYLASLAEDVNFEHANEEGWWAKLKGLFLDFIEGIGLKGFRDRSGFVISDNELRYILWRSYQNLAEPGRYRNIFASAEDIAMQSRMKVGNYAVSDIKAERVAEVNETEAQEITPEQEALLDGRNFRQYPSIQELEAKLAKKSENAHDDDENLLYRPGDFTPRDRVMARDYYNRVVATGNYQFQEAVQDSMLGLKTLYQSILGKGVRIEDVAGFENAYLYENRMSSTSAAEQHEYFIRFMKPLLLEVAAICGANQRKRRELTDYIMAKHGLERNEYMRKEAASNGKETERDFAGLTGLTGESDWQEAEAVAQQWVDDYEAVHDTAALWTAINNATKTTLEKVYTSGIISKETYEKTLDMYDYYVPLRGWNETTSDEVYGYLTSKNGPLNGSIVKSAEGRSSMADDPIATIAMMADDAIRQGNRNLMKQRFLNFVLNYPSDAVSVHDIWLEYDDVNDEWRPVFADVEATDTADIVAQKVDAFEQRMESLRQSAPDKYKKGREAQHIPYKVVRGNLREHQVLIKRNGRTFVATINGNPRAAQAINGLTNPDVDVNGVVGNMLKGVQYVNRQLSAFYTTRNPDFVVSNFFRDMLYSNCMTWVKESPRYAMRFHKNFGVTNPVKLHALLRKWEDGTLDRSNRIENLFYEFMRNGGETGYTNVKDIDGHKRTIAAELKKQGSVGRKAWTALGNELDVLNRSAENCARFAAFVTSREFGRSIDRAIYDAKEVSVNFNKKGSGGKMVNAVGQTRLGKTGAYLGGAGRLLYVFWGAGVQGLTNVGRAAKLHPAKFTAAAASMITLGYVVPLLSQMFMGGDGDGDGEDDKNAYYNLPEYIRRSNICFRAGEQWVTIPLPIEFRAMYGLGELAYGVTTGNERYSDEELMYQIAGQVSQIMPIDMLEGGGGISPFLPSAFKPLTEAYIMNKGWTGLPVYKDTPFNQNDPEWTKAYASADQHLVAFAKYLNETSGGDDYKKGSIDINPAKVEYLLNGTFGGVVSFPNKVKKSVETAFGDREFEWRNIPLANRLIKSGDERTANRKLREEYFKYKKEVENTERLNKKYLTAQDNGMIEYAEKVNHLQNSPEFARSLIFDEYDYIINGYNDEIATETDPQRKKELEAMMYGEMRELVNALRDPDKALKEIYGEAQ